MQTILGTFDDPQTAQRAVEQLVEQGFSRSSVHLQSGANAGSDNSILSSVGSFFSRLFESDEKTEAGNYAEAVRRGSSVVAVDANTDEEVHQAQFLMHTLGSVDVDARAAQWKTKGWHGFDADAAPLSESDLASERAAVPVVQEELVVGKRAVDVGGLRVVKRMSETPVSEMVNLRQEKATITRKPVDRPATEADFGNFKEGSFEVGETAEEAVIGKTARVVEEVSVGRDVTNRSETVSDTVRRTDVEVERMPGTRSEMKSDPSKR
jgi:uncharacterized protein (TIGR02271 family)